jgi:hypothetical protein
MGVDNITKASTRQEVLKAFPGAQRALFSRYHIGGCSHGGFGPTETLEQVSRRHNLLSRRSSATSGRAMSGTRRSRSYQRSSRGS